MPRRYLISTASAELIERTRTAAYELRTTRAGIIRQAVEQFLRRHERERRKGGAAAG